MQGSVGWICPKCGAIISPYDQTCAKCAPKPTIGTYTGWSGTITLGGVDFGKMFSTSGTVYAAPAKTDAQKLAEAKADAADWRDKFERVIEAMREVIEEHQDEDEDD